MRCPSGTGGAGGSERVCVTHGGKAGKEQPPLELEGMPITGDGMSNRHNNGSSHDNSHDNSSHDNSSHDNSHDNSSHDTSSHDNSHDNGSHDTSSHRLGELDCKVVLRVARVDELDVGGLHARVVGVGVFEQVLVQPQPPIERRHAVLRHDRLVAAAERVPQSAERTAATPARGGLVAGAECIFDAVE